MADITKIKKQLKKTLDHKRYEHTLGVAYIAAALAMRYAIPGEKSGSGRTLAENAFLAGLLHDCAKCMDNEKKLAYCKKHKISVSHFEESNPFLLHAKVGQHLAREEFHVKDEDILHAICYHTTGRPGMSLLEKIIFIADYIEPGRTQAPNLEEIRSTAFQSLDRTMVMILSDTLEYLKQHENKIDPQTGLTYAYYKELEGI